jgi:hypothetical protein
MEEFLSVYVGTPENGHEDYLFLDLVVGPYEVEIDRSSESLDGMSGEDLLLSLEELLNIASLFRKSLKLPILIDTDSILLESVEENMDEKTLKNIKLLIKEVMDRKEK